MRVQDLPVMQPDLHSDAGGGGDDEDDSWAAFESAESTPFASPAAEASSGGDPGAFSSPPSSGFFSASTTLDLEESEREDQDRTPETAGAWTPEFDSGSAPPPRLDESFGGPLAEYALTGGANTSVNDAALFGFVGSTTENDADRQEDAPFEAVAQEEHKPQQEENEPSAFEFATLPEATAFTSTPIIDDAFMSDLQIESPQPDVLAADESATGPASESPFMESNDNKPSTANIGFEAVETETLVSSDPIAHDSFSFDEEGDTGKQDGNTEGNNIDIDNDNENDNNNNNDTDNNSRGDNDNDNVNDNDNNNNEDGGGVNADDGNTSADVGTDVNDNGDGDGDGGGDDDDDDDDDEFGDFDFAEPVAATETAKTTMAAVDGNTTSSSNNNFAGDDDDMDEFGEMEGNNHVEAPAQGQVQAGVSQVTPTQPKKVVWEMSKEEYTLHINDILSSSFSNHVSLENGDFEPLLATGSVEKDNSVSIPSAGAEDVDSQIIDIFIAPVLKEHPRLYEDLFDEPEPNEMNVDDDESFRAVNQAGNLNNNHFAHSQSAEVHHGAHDGVSDTLSFTGQEGAGIAKTSLPLQGTPSVPTGGGTNPPAAEFDMKVSNQNLEQTMGGTGGVSTPPWGNECDFVGPASHQQQQPKPQEYHGHEEERMSSSQPDAFGGAAGPGWDMFADMNVVQSSKGASPDTLDIAPHQSWQEKEQQTESQGNLRSDQLREDIATDGNARNGTVNATPSSSSPLTMAADLFTDMEITSTHLPATVDTADAGSHVRDDDDGGGAAGSAPNYIGAGLTEKATESVSEQHYDLETSNQGTPKVEGGSTLNGAVAEDRRIEESTAIPEMLHHDGLELQQRQQKEAYALDEDNMFASMEIMGASHPGEVTPVPATAAAPLPPVARKEKEEEASAVEMLASVPAAEAEAAAAKATDDWSGWESPDKLDAPGLSDSVNPIQSFAPDDQDALVASSAEKEDEHDSQAGSSIAGYGASPPSPGINLFADMEIAPTSTPAATEEVVAAAPFEFGGPAEKDGQERGSEMMSSPITGHDAGLPSPGANLFADMEIASIPTPAVTEEAVSEVPFEFGGFAGVHTSAEPSSQLPNQGKSEREAGDGSFQVSSNLYAPPFAESKDSTHASEFRNEAIAPRAVPTAGPSSSLETQEWGAFGQAEESSAVPAYTEAGSGGFGAASAPGLEHRNSSSNSGWSSSPPENISPDGFSSWTFAPNPSVQAADDFGSFSYGGSQSGSGDTNIPGANQAVGTKDEGGGGDNDDGFGAFASPDISGGAAPSAVMPAATSGAAAPPPPPLEPTPFTWHSVPVPVHLSFMLSDSILKGSDSGALL